MWQADHFGHLFSGNSLLFATLTVIGLDSGARAQLPVIIEYAVQTGTTRATAVA